MSWHVGYFDNINIVHYYLYLIYRYYFLNFSKFSKSNRTIPIQILSKSPKSGVSNPYKFGHLYVFHQLPHPLALSKLEATRNVKMLDTMNMRDAKTGELLLLGCCMQVTTRAAIINWK